jgi:DNA invertase Pin-like site-specific DNA recombinase
MAWSVDRLGRSLPDLVAFLNDIQSKNVDLYLHQQGLDTSTPSGRMMFQMLSVFAEFERAMIRERILAGLRRTTKKSGRKPMPDDRVEAIRRSLINGQGIRATARLHRASTTTVTTIKRSLETV